MTTWNYRLFKDIFKDANGRDCERISIVSVYYDEEGNITAKGDDDFTFDQFAEIDFPEFTSEQRARGEATVNMKELSYLPIDETNAKQNIMFTATKVLEASIKPVLTAKDFEHLPGYLNAEAS